MNIPGCAREVTEEERFCEKVIRALRHVTRQAVRWLTYPTYVSCFSCKQTRSDDEPWTRLLEEKAIGRRLEQTEDGRTAG